MVLVREDRVGGAEGLNSGGEQKAARGGEQSGFQALKQPDAPRTHDCPAVMV